MEKQQYNELRDAAARWLNGKRDFDKGIAILEKAQFKPGVINVLKRHGSQGPCAMERLEYHIGTFMKVWFDKSLAEDTDLQLGVVDGQKVASDDEDVALMSDDMEQKMHAMPKKISDVVAQYRDAYIARDKAFKELKSMPEDNGEDTVKRREELSNEMEKQADKMDRLYPVYRKFLDTGEVTDPEPEPAEPKKRVNIEDGLADIETMRKHELRRLRHSLRVKIMRAKNMLDFQTETKQDVLNPMPDGLNRIKYESKIKRLQGELAKIDVEIAKRS